MITLTITPSEHEVISGIPQSVEITTNLPSTIYYTLDGTMPSLLSDVYVGPITLPTLSGSVVVSAVAYYLDEDTIVPSSILTETYTTDVTALNRTRYVFFEGIVYSYPGGADIPFYYDHAGDPVFYIDIPASEIEFLQSETDAAGNYLGTDNQISIINPDYTGSLQDNTAPAYSSANNPGEFRPDAAFIEVDGRASAPVPVQVNILNGPLISLRNSRTSWSGIDYRTHGSENYFSGSATKYHYNREKNVIVFSYFDSNSSRWIKSIQDLPPVPENLPRPQYGPPHVYKWFMYGRQIV